MRAKKQINVEIGEQIRYARERVKLTQEQFAERIEVSPQYVSDLERGVVGISIATLKRACMVLGVSSDQVLFGAASENRAAMIEETCRCLSDAQFAIFAEIAGKFAKAVNMDKST